MKRIYLILIVFWVFVLVLWFAWGRSALAPIDQVDPTPTDTSASSTPLRLVSPQAGQTVSSPLEISGQAPGTWFFEASFPVKLYDGAGKLLGQGVMQAQSDWMTVDFVPFKGSIDFRSASGGEAELVFEKDNPSGLPENVASWSIPLVLSPSKPEMVLKNYFMNDRLDPDITCTKVWPIEISLERSTAVASSALARLLSGPSDEAKAKGYYSSIPSGVRVLSLSVNNGIARVDFSAELDKGVAGSCLVSAIRTQIEETLKQFPEVREVSLSVEGRTEDALQP